MVSSTTRRRRSTPVLRALAAIAMLVCAVAPSHAQSRDDATLRRDVERRFEVLPLQDGVALRPRGNAHGIRSIELSGDTIAIDGSPVTGGEVRTRLGSDADLVLRLSYLDPAARRALFPAGGAAGAPSVPSAPPPAPAPPAAPEPPSAAPAPPAAATPERPQTERRRRSSRGGRVRFGEDVTVRPGEVLNDDVVVFGASATIEGVVNGDVVAIGGSVDLRPGASVSGDVASIGGSVHRDPGAQVGGSINEVGAGRLAGRIGGLRTLPFVWGASLFGAGVALVSTVTRFAVLCLIACLVILIGRDYVDRVAMRAAAEPVKAGAVGLLAELLFIPLLVISILVLVVTIIGIPLLVLIPFAILALAVIFVVGFTAVAHHLGGYVCDRFGWPRDNPYLVTVAGIALVLSPVILARIIGLGGGLLFPLTAALVAIGVIFEYLVWTVGFGAVALLRFNRPGGAAGAAVVTTDASA